MTHDTFTCDALDARLSDYLEGTLDAGARASVERHLAACARCASLVADLRAIAQHAGELPELVPERDLWTDIERRIEPAVIPLAPARTTHARRYTRSAWLGATAAALVAATASVTYVATRHSFQQQQQQQVAAVSGGDSAATPSRPVSPSASESLAAPAAPQRIATAPESARPRPAATTVARVPKVPGEIAYDREIGRLERIVHERRSELDTSTVAVIEKNLRVIDAAIADSRAALARDPRSRFLNDQLNDALDRKVELLRTVAFLPSGT